MQPEHLSHPVPQPPVVGVERSEAPDVDGHEVARRLALDDPFGEGPSGTASRRDPDRVEPGPDEEALQVWRLAQDELVVGREALRAVVQLLQPGVLKDGDPVHRRFHEDAEVVPVLLQELELERVRQRVGRDPGLGRRLESADDEAADLLLDVGVPVGVAQDGEVRVDARDGLGHDVEVLGRVEGDVDAAEEADGFRPLPGAVHHHLGLDGTAVGHDAGHPAVPCGHALHPGVLLNADAAEAGPAGERRRHVDGVDGRVARQPQSTQQIARLQDRIPLQGLGGCEQLAVEVVGLGRGRGPAELDHPLGRARHGHAAAPLETGGEAGLRLEFAIEAGGVLHETGAGLGRPELAEESRRVPRRATREQSLLQQEDVGPPETGQVVRGRGPDDATTDDDDSGPVGQVAPGRCMLHGRPPPRQVRPQSARATSDRSRSRSGPAKVASARSNFSIPQLQNPKSIGLVASWMDAHNVHPYWDMGPQRRARARWLREVAPSYAPTSSSSWSRLRWHSLQMLPSSK